MSIFNGRGRLLSLCILLLLITGVSLELICRYWLGLGDPPLTIRDSKIEYMFAPDSCYVRFGNRVCYNHWSMRSPSSDKFDLLVLGDSVVNGGSLSDQDHIATEMIAKHYHLQVGNISAGSWGPPNLLAYVNRFGWFQAKTVAVVLSTHDLKDIPLFPVDLGPDFPQKKPMLAIAEVIGRYLPRYIPMLRSPPSLPTVDIKNPDTTEDFIALMKAASSDGRNACLFFHHDRDGKEGAVPAFRSIAEQGHAKFFVLDELPEYYRDDIHLNDVGQARLAREIERKCLGLDLEGRPVGNTSPGR